MPVRWLFISLCLPSQTSLADVGVATTSEHQEKLVSPATVKQMMEHGFTETQVMEQLSHCHGDANAALANLFTADLMGQGYGEQEASEAAVGDGRLIAVPCTAVALQHALICSNFCFATNGAATEFVRLCRPLTSYWLWLWAAGATVRHCENRSGSSPIPAANCGHSS